MIVALLISIIALLLTWLEAKGALKWGMGWAFVLLTVIEAIHYDFGNDYMGYMGLYDYITKNPFNLNAILNGNTWREPGWEFLNHAFVPLGGFFGLVAFISVVQNVIYFNLIRRYVTRSWWVMAVFIYLFNPDFYLLNMSMLRQGLAVSLFVMALPYIIEKKLIPAAIIVFIAASLHNSAKILIPFIFWGWLPTGKRTIKIIAFTSAILMFLLVYNDNLLQWIFTGVLNLDERLDSENMANYMDIYSKSNVVVTFGLGFAISIVPFIMTLYYLFRNNKVSSGHQQIVSLAMVGTFVIPFAQIIPLISRVSLYFTTLTIATIPIVYKWIPNNIVRYAAIAICVFWTLYSYYGFFFGDIYGKHYAVYHTIFSVI